MIIRLLLCLHCDMKSEIALAMLAQYALRRGQGPAHPLRRQVKKFEHAQCNSKGCSGLWFDNPSWLSCQP